MREGRCATIPMRLARLGVIVAIAGAAFWVTGCMERVFYQPTREATPLPVELKRAGAVSVEFQSKDGTHLHGWFVPARDGLKAAEHAPTILHVHGNAGNISAYWMGYDEFHRLGKATKRPRMLGFQAAGAAPIYFNKVVEHPETIATAIRIGNPASWDLAVAAMRDSGGSVDIVTDEAILAAQSWLATNEGIFVEPASAASIAGLP